MNLLQILLPMQDNTGDPFPAELYTKVRSDLAERFGGLTAYTRAPAQGLWRNQGETTHDEIVVFEVMVEELDREWWADYRAALEELFRQDQIVIRALPLSIF
jgi:hypothetical protein